MTGYKANKLSRSFRFRKLNLRLFRCHFTCLPYSIYFINTVIRDTVFIRDTVPVVQQKVEMVSPHIQLDAVIDNDSLKGDIRLPVTLQQTVWVEYKRKCLFWKKVKAIHQTISSDNPYVDIKHSEYIQIDKK